MKRNELSGPIIFEIFGNEHTIGVIIFYIKVVTIILVLIKWYKI